MGELCLGAIQSRSSGIHGLIKSITYRDGSGITLPGVTRTIKLFSLKSPTACFATASTMRSRAIKPLRAAACRPPQTRTAAHSPSLSEAPAGSHGPALASPKCRRPAPCGAGRSNHEQESRCGRGRTMPGAASRKKHFGACHSSLWDNRCRPVGLGINSCGYRHSLPVTDSVSH